MTRQGPVIATTLLTLTMMGCAEPDRTGVTEHPCVLLTAETLPALKAKAADMTENRFGFSTGEAWQQFKAKADGFLTAEPYHYRVNIPTKPGLPVLTWEYTLSDENPPRHDERPSYPPWTAMFQERSDSITTRLKYLSLAYLITGERAYADRAKRIVMHLTHWDQWTDPSYGGGKIKACLDTGHATKCVGFFYDWCFDTLTPREAATIREAIIEKGIMAILADASRYPPETNGFAVLTSGLACAALAVRPDDARGDEWIQTAMEMTKQSFDLGGSDGGAFEGPGYGTYLLDSFANVLDAVTAAQVENDLFDHPFLATMDQYVISNLTPDGRVMPNFADGGPTAGYPETMAILAQRGSTASAWYLEQTHNLNVDTIYRFIRFDADKLNPVQPTFNPSRAFVDIGYAILRDGYEPHTPYLAFKSGPPDRNIGHNHFDSNGFQLSYLGEFLIADHGYRNSYVPPKTKFTQGAIGHSSVVLDITDEYLASTKSPDLGHDQIHRAGGRIEQFFSTPVLDYVQGQAAATYNDDEHTIVEDFTRQILYFKPYFFVMLDHLKTPDPHTFHLCLQLSPRSQSEEVEENRWNINGLRAQLACWLRSPQGITSSAQFYPGAEEYGEYLTASTKRLTEANFLTVMYPRPYESDTLLRNPGFEGSYVGWTIRANEDAPNHVIDTEVKRSGESSGRIDGSGYYYSQKFEVKPGEKVRGWVWLRTEGSTNGGQVYLYWWKGGKSIGYVRSERLKPTDWEKVELEGLAPEGAEQVCLACTYHDTGVGWYDDAGMWLETPPEFLQIKRPLPEMVQFAPAGDGLTLAIEGVEFGLIKGGPEVKLGDHAFATDGTLAAMCARADWQWLYLQDGSALLRDGGEVLKVERPMTICLWRGQQEREVHVLARDDLTPHAQPLPATEIKLTVQSTEPIAHAFCGDQELSVTDRGDRTWLITG